MNEMATAIGLDRGLGEFPDLAGTGEFGVEIDRGRRRLNMRIENRSGLRRGASGP